MTKPIHEYQTFWLCDLNLGYIFWLVGTRALTFLMSFPCEKTFPWVPNCLTLWAWPWCLTYLPWLKLLIVCLFVCFESHEQFFSYLATVTITGDRAANLDLFLALAAFSSEGSFTCHTYCDTGRSYPKDPWFRLYLLAKEQSLPILNVLSLTRPARAGLELTTYRLLSESTTTRLRQPVWTILVNQKHSSNHSFRWMFNPYKQTCGKCCVFMIKNLSLHTCIVYASKYVSSA
jgi:hypothetical protein